MGGILELVMNLVGPAIELGKCVIPPIKRQINYLCCFNSNIKSLRDEAKKLDEAREGLQMRVAEAENNAQVIFPEVRTWLTSANTKIEVNLIEIENVIPKVQSGLFTMKSRFLLSKKARKTAEAMKELIQKHSNFNHISVPTPPPAMVSIPLGPTYEFESRKQIEEGIMEALRGKKVKIMGICGMGGVGKTMMAKRIMNRVKKEHLFDEVVMSAVSQKVDEMKIQREIAESLGLTFKGETLSARAHQLRARLKGMKRTLIVLDDLWDRLKLEELGIPDFESGDERNCTILLTSRDKVVLNVMGAQPIFGIETLSEAEAWFLFREKAGSCVDDLSLLSVAKQVANECRGLPIALITVSRALKDEKSKQVWYDVLHQLKDSNPMDRPEIIKEVYTPLRLSYDFLEGQHAKTLFLLCCLFPDDFDISLEYLTMYCIGLRTFEGLRNLEQVRNRVFALVKMLKNRFLLLDGYNEHHVKMHDVVRDVAIYIASQERSIDVNLQKMNWLSEQFSNSDCKWISLFPTEESKLPNLIGLNFPSLGLFIMHERGWREVEIKDFHFFEGMKELNVFSCKSISLKSLPQTIQMLKDLRTLHLENCSLKDISVVGELSSLEILSCSFCHNIHELPVEIGRLNRLKLLEFSNCRSLRKIVPGIISNLVALEELKLIGSFNGWELAKASEERCRNVSLNELESLSNLTCLEIEVGDYNLISEEIHLSSKIIKYRIGIKTDMRDFEGSYDKDMALSLPTKVALGNWVQVFLKDTERLLAEGDGSSILDLSQAHNMKSLIFSDCGTVKYLVNTTTTFHCNRFGVFPVLEYLRLSNLSNLEEICQGPIPEGSISFKNLREFHIQSLAALKTLWKSPSQIISLGNLSTLSIYGCHKLPNLFPLIMAKGLLQLEKLGIVWCEIMEELFSNEENGIKSHITFLKLKELRLNDLPNLTTLCKGIESIEFPELIDLTIADCPKLMSYVSPTTKYEKSGDDHNDADCDSFHLFYNQKVSFPVLEFLMLSHVRNLENICEGPIAEGSNFFKNLKELALLSCPTLKYLWKSPDIKKNISLNINNEACIYDNKDGLLQLVKLEIDECEMMQQVLLNEEDKYYGRFHLTFPKLKSLKLRRSPNLTAFSEGIEIIDFPVLSDMLIFDCPKLTSIVSPMDANGHDDDTSHLFCRQEVTIGRLKNLTMEGYKNISKIWCHQVPDSFFTRLKSLKIVECDSIRSLFSSAIARNLVNLRYVKIAGCKEMVKVIGDEEEIIKEACLFPRLEYLVLSDLPKLGTFCEWRCEVELPKLHDAYIQGCPLMKTFTMGSLITPELRRVQRNYVSASENLNSLSTTLL